MHPEEIQYVVGRICTDFMSLEMFTVYFDHIRFYFSCFSFPLLFFSVQCSRLSCLPSAFEHTYISDRIILYKLR